MSWGPDECAACRAQGGGLCPKCWRTREREREQRVEAIRKHDTRLFNAWAKDEISEAELFEQLHPEGDRSRIARLVGLRKAARAAEQGRGERRGARKSDDVFGGGKAG